MAVVNMTRAEAVKIARAGAKAASAGSKLSACPFKVTGSPDERMKAAAWLRGYTSKP